MLCRLQANRRTEKSRAKIFLRARGPGLSAQAGKHRASGSVMQWTTKNRRSKKRKSIFSEERSHNSFDSALDAACTELERFGRFTCTLSEMLYRLFRIRAQRGKWSGDECNNTILEDVVQECMLNFWNGLRRPGKMRSHLRTLTGISLRAYVAGTIRLLILRQKWLLLKNEVRQRGYWFPPAVMTRELDEENARNWWDDLPAAEWERRGAPTVSPLDLEQIMAGQPGGFERKVVEAAAEFFAASGHKDFADELLAAAKVTGQRNEKSKRTTQRRMLENKRQLKKKLGEHHGCDPAHS